MSEVQVPEQQRYVLSGTAEDLTALIQRTMAAPPGTTAWVDEPASKGFVFKAIAGAAVVSLVSVGIGYTVTNAVRKHRFEASPPRRLKIAK